MKYVFVLLACAGCQNDCVVAQAAVVQSGSASLRTSEGTFETTLVAWTEASAPTNTKNVSFWIEFGDRPSVQCDRIAWSSLAHGAIVNVSEACVLTDGTHEAHLAGATLSVTSAMDASNEGSITLRFGAPDQTVTLAGDVEIAVDALVVEVPFVHTECSSGCSSFDLSGV